MPLHYLRRLSGEIRTPESNRQLARYLAFVAGATNAGGFLAVHQYTSHMTGIISAMADNLTRGSISVALGGLAGVVAFLSGAVCTTILIRWARGKALKSQYAIPLALEAVLLLVFGITGRRFVDGGGLVGTVVLLCFTMGMQNAMITKLSDAVIRTTHLTGMITDIGIELGRSLNFPDGRTSPVGPNRNKLVLLSSLVFIFFCGGVTGAFGFKHTGFWFTIPLAAILMLIAFIPILDDLRAA